MCQLYNICNKRATQRTAFVLMNLLNGWGVETQPPGLRGRADGDTLDVLQDDNTTRADQVIPHSDQQINTSIADKYFPLDAPTLPAEQLQQNPSLTFSDAPDPATPCSSSVDSDDHPMLHRWSLSSVGGGVGVMAGGVGPGEGRIIGGLAWQALHAQKALTVSESGVSKSLGTESRVGSDLMMPFFPNSQPASALRQDGTQESPPSSVLDGSQVSDNLTSVSEGDILLKHTGSHRNGSGSNSKGFLNILSRVRGICKTPSSTPKELPTEEGDEIADRPPTAVPVNVSMLTLAPGWAGHNDHFTAHVEAPTPPPHNSNRTVLGKTHGKHRMAWFKGVFKRKRPVDEQLLPTVSDTAQKLAIDSGIACCEHSKIHSIRKEILPPSPVSPSKPPFVVRAVHSPASPAFQGSPVLHE